MTQTTDQRDWAAIRRAYEEGDEPVASICARHGVGSTVLYERIAAEGWRRRRPDLSLANRRAGGFKRSRAVVIDRLYKLLEKQLAGIAARAEARAGEGASDDDTKRDIDASAAILRLLERLTDLSRRDAAPPRGAKAAADNKGSNTTEDDEADAERLRRELAHRLARLAGKDHI